MSFPRYPAYVPSDADFIKSVPAHWSVKPLWACCTCNDDVLPESTTDDQVIRYVEISDVTLLGGMGSGEEMLFASAPSRARRRVRKGDTIVSTVRTYLRAIAPVDTDDPKLVVSTGFAVVRPRDVHPGYLRYVLASEEMISSVISQSKGVSYPAINAGDLMRLKAAFPPQPEQRLIADFLDRETAKLDTLAAEQEGLLELLEEKRAAVIAHLATRGLDPSVPTKDSGIEWLGRVPKHWQRAKLKHVGSIQGGAGFPDDFQYNPDERIPFYKVANLGMSLDGRTIGPSVHTVSEETAQLLRAAIIPAGSIVYAKIGAAMLLNRRRLVAQDSCIDNNMSALTVDERKANRDWVFLWTQVLDFKRLANPGPVPSFSEGVQRELPILIPPRGEQEALVERVYTETRAMDALSAEARVSIDLLRERRTALISAAVTGRIDMRAAASRDLGEAA